MISTRPTLYRIIAGSARGFGNAKPLARQTARLSVDEPARAVPLWLANGPLALAG